MLESEEMSYRCVEAKPYEIEKLYGLVMKKYRYTSMLESLGDVDAYKSRYSVIGILADELLYEKEQKKYLYSVAEDVKTEVSWLDVLDTWCEIPKKGEQPFCTGAIGYIGYDNNRDFEMMLQGMEKDHTVPELFLVHYSLIYVYDRLQQKANWIVGQGVDYENVIKEVSQEYEKREFSVAEFQSLGDICCDFTKDEYLDIVNKCISYIKRGDLLQANITMRFHGNYTGNPFAVYLKLRESTPNPFFAYMDFDAPIISTSPESFLCISGGDITSSPIKGTIRCNIGGIDQIEELKMSEKDFSENVMITDLIRNDIGRVSKIGTVQVPDLCKIKRFNQLYHFETIVTGKMEESVKLSEVFRWNFPGGSITGAPKVKAMEVIEELELKSRSVYCGITGFFGDNGYLNTSIGIRTLYFQQGTFWLHGGGAIVVDSDAKKEYDEMLLKVEKLIETMNTFHVLKQDREEIEKITLEMLSLLAERITRVRNVGKLKKKYHIPIYQESRITELIDRAKEKNRLEQLGLEDGMIEAFLHVLIDIAMKAEESDIRSDEFEK